MHALLRPPPATTRHLNMNKLRAGNCPQAGSLLHISYKYLGCCPLARGRQSTHIPPHSPSTAVGAAGRGWPHRTWSSAGKTRAVAFPKLLHPVVSFQASLFPICYASVTKLLTFRNLWEVEVCVPVLEHPHSFLLPWLGSHGYKAQEKVWEALGKWLWAEH